MNVFYNIHKFQDNVLRKNPKPNKQKNSCIKQGHQSSDYTKTDT